MSVFPETLRTSLPVTALALHGPDPEDPLHGNHCNLLRFVFRLRDIQGTEDRLGKWGSEFWTGRVEFRS
jgi:hypothetical protein